MATLKMHAPRAVLTLDEGEAVEVERLGRGRYTVAWRAVDHADTVYLQVRQGGGGDYSKEILSHLQGEPYIPILENIGETSDNIVLWRTRYYAPIGPRHKAAWREYKALRGHAETGWRETLEDIRYRRTDADMARRSAERFGTLVEEDTSLPEALRETCASLVTWCGTYGEYAIEIMPRNLAVDDAGGLILLDPCFNYAEVQASNAEARKKRGIW